MNISPTQAPTGAEQPSADMLDYVRKNLQDLSSSQYMRIAADAGLALQTVMTVATAKRDPMYSTVKRLHEILLKRNADVAQAG